MKNLLFLLLFIPVIGYSQQRTSYDVLTDLQNKVGLNIKPIDKDITSLIKEYGKLRVKELNDNITLDNLAVNKIVPNSPIQFCLTCRCPNDGYFDGQPCGLSIPNCGICPACHAELQAYIQNCINSPCQQF